MNESQCYQQIIIIPSILIIFLWKQTLNQFSLLTWLFIALYIIRSAITLPSQLVMQSLKTSSSGKVVEYKYVGPINVSVKIMILVQGEC